MITQTTSRHSSYLSRTALAVVLAAMTAGCSGAIERFEDPIYTGGTNNQRSILSGSPSQPSYADIAAGPTASTVRTGKVESAALPPPASSGSGLATGSIPKTSSASPTFRPVATTPSASAASSTVAAVEGKTVRGWTTVGGTRISAKSGDSVASLSRRYGVPQYVLADINGLDANASLQPGQSLIVPTYVHGNGRAQAAATQTLPPQGPAPSATGSIPTAAAGALAALPKAKPAAVRLASVSNTASDAVKVNKPSGKPAEKLTASAPGTPSPKVELNSTQIEPVRVIGTQKQEPDVAPTKVAAVSSSDPDEGRFRWPVRGRIISDFGVKPGGTRNDGINLAVPEGAEVKAADDGVVIYSGNELKGYGNLVLVRHSDGWVSAYAHNSKLSVSRGDNVRRGDTIGLAGTTGSVSQPQVHFELRKGNKPIDPLRYLAKL